MTKEEFNLLLSEGEGYRLEFKENLSRLDREFVAFANASDSRVVLGSKMTALWLV